ncbi:MAG: RnfABCDGE type electron transport complex subunit D [Spirochaetales bacterium]|nr:RnfABCDGE type electron transport complex subunit D [Spirochaetales bacterium]
MNQVVYALLPLCLAAVYFYGWRFILVLAVVNGIGFLSEYLFVRKNKQPVSSAVFVTSFIFALSLPPTIPLWIASVGIAFGIVFGKMVFGGFGRNVFNPAVSGRAFIYISFGVPLTSGFTPAVPGAAGGFTAWQPAVDAITKATPLVKMAQGETISTLTLFLGKHAGSFGETSAILVLLCGLFLIIKKTASYQIVLSGIAGFLLLQSLFYFGGVEQAAHPVQGLLAGTILFGIFFMATDPVSASQTTTGGKWIYGAMIGLLTSLIRTFSVWSEGFTFALLIANMFAPLLDHVMKTLKKRKKEVVKA